MSKQLALSAAFSTLAMAALALSAAPPPGNSAGQLKGAASTLAAPHQAITSFTR